MTLQQETMIRSSATPQVQVVSLDQMQSTELVKIMIVGVISNIMYSRCAFHKEAYELRFFNLKPNLSYHDFKNKEIETAGHSGPTGPKIMILSRNKNRRADTLLDWIEFGIFDAVKNKFLASAQLGFFNGEVSPENLIESFIISFTYEDGAPKIGLKHSSSSRGVDFESAREDMENILYTLARKLEDDLEVSCTKKTVSIQLMYNNSCSNNYVPPYFKSCSNPELVLDRQAGVLFGDIDTIHHRLCVRLHREYAVHPGSSQPLPPDLDNGREDKNPKGVWKAYGGTLEGHQHDSPKEYLNYCHATHSSIHKISKQAANELKHEGKIPAVAWERKNNKNFRYTATRCSSTTLSESKNSPSYSGPLNIPALQEAELMIGRLPSINMASNIPDAPLSQQSWQVRDVRALVTSRNQDTFDTQAVMDLAGLSRPTPLMTLEPSRTQYTDDMEKQVLPEDWSLDRLFKGESEEEVLCGACQQSCQFQCYGYVSREELPNYFLCYSCMLCQHRGKQDEMEALSQYRNFLYNVYMEGYPTVENYMLQKLDVSFDTWNTMVTYFKKGGYLIDNPDLMKPKDSSGFLLTAKYQTVRTASQMKKLFNDYFDPHAGLHHYFDPPRTGSSMGDLPVPSALPWTQAGYARNSLHSDCVMDPALLETQSAGSSTQREEKAFENATGENVSDQQPPNRQILGDGRGFTSEELGFFTGMLNSPSKVMANKPTYSYTGNSGMSNGQQAQGSRNSYSQDNSGNRMSNELHKQGTPNPHSQNNDGLGMSAFSSTQGTPYSQAHRATTNFGNGRQSSSQANLRDLGGVAGFRSHATRIQPVASNRLLYANPAVTRHDDNPTEIRYANSADTLYANSTGNLYANSAGILTARDIARLREENGETRPSPFSGIYGTALSREWPASAGDDDAGQQRWKAMDEMNMHSNRLVTGKELEHDTTARAMRHMDMEDEEMLGRRRGGSFQRSAEVPETPVTAYRKDAGKRQASLFDDVEASVDRPHSQKRMRSLLDEATTTPQVNNNAVGHRLSWEKLLNLNGVMDDEEADQFLFGQAIDWESQRNAANK